MVGRLFLIDLLIFREGKCGYFLRCPNQQKKKGGLCRVRCWYVLDYVCIIETVSCAGLLFVFTFLSCKLQT